MIKVLNKLGIEETDVNTINAIYDKPAANTILNSESLKDIPLRSGTGQGSPNIQHRTGHPSQRNQARKRNMQE